MVLSDLFLAEYWYSTNILRDVTESRALTYMNNVYFLY